jgi:hypothetical protein
MDVIYIADTHLGLAAFTAGWSARPCPERPDGLTLPASLS